MTTLSRLPLAAALALSTAFTAHVATAQDTPPAEQTPPANAQAPQTKTWSDLDANKDGALSAEEAKEVPSLSTVFAKADADGDGALTGDEYRQYLAANPAKTGQQK